MHNSQKDIINPETGDSESLFETLKKAVSQSVLILNFSKVL